MKGFVFNIQRFSINDGPGIRSTVFLKGCNLRCQWCHNPESLKSKQEIQYFDQLCIKCNQCVEVCPSNAIYLNEAGKKVFDRKKCIYCGNCVEACPANALKFVGEHMESEDVVSTLLKDIDFYKNSGGGITISGGEPLLQKDFVKEIFTKTKDMGIHNTLDTAAFVDWEILEEVLPLTDLILLDLKVMDHEIHFERTGVYNHKILENAMKLAESDVDIIIRIPVIPTVNASIQNMEHTAEFLSKFKRLIKVQLLPYHSLGVDKNNTLGKTDGIKLFSEPKASLMEDLAKYFNKYQIVTEID